MEVARTTSMTRPMTCITQPPRVPGPVDPELLLLRVLGPRGGWGEMEAGRGVAFEVRAGEAVGLLGAKGAGKTTILKALMGLVPAGSGRIEFDGKPLADRPGWERGRSGIAWVPE